TRPEPHWSRAVAENACCAPGSTVAVAGPTIMLVSVSFTTTPTLLLVLREPSKIVTAKVYVPAFVNVATVLFAAFVPLAENVTGAGAVPVVVEVSVSPPSPPSSAPSAARAVVVPVTGAGVAPAGVTTVGAALLGVLP